MNFNTDPIKQLAKTAGRGQVIAAQLMLNCITIVIMLLGIRRGLSNRLTNAPHVLDSLRLDYAEWIRPYYFPEHRFTIYVFVAAIFLVGCMSIAIGLVASKRTHGPVARIHWITLAASVALLIFVALSLVLDAGSIVTYASAAILAAILCATAFPDRFSGWLRAVPSPTFGRVILAVVAIDFVLTMLPLALNRVPFLRSSFDISTKVTVRDSADSKQVDEITFVNQHNLWGNHNLPDGRSAPGRDAACLEGNRLKIHLTDTILAFVRQNKYKYYVQNPRNELCFVGRMTLEEQAALIAASPAERDEIGRTFFANQRINEALDEKALTKREKSFIAATMLSTTGIIHEFEDAFFHHFHFVYPLHEMQIGRPLNEIKSPYGLVVVPIYYVLKAFGDVTYQGLLFLINSSYILYFGALLCLVAWTTRSVWSAAAAALIFFGSIKALGVSALFVGSGYAPVRHLIDVVAMACVLSYLRSSRAGWLILAVVFSIANVWLDKFLGSFCAVALAGLIVIRLVNSFAVGNSSTARKTLETVALVGLIAGTFASFAVVSRAMAPDFYASEFLAGVWGFPTSTLRLAIVLALFLFLFATAQWSAIRKPTPEKGFLIFLICFAVLWYFYWIMLPNYGHWYAMLPYTGFAVVVWFREVLPEFSIKAGMQRVLQSVAFVGAVLFWMVQSSLLLGDAAVFARHFADHEIFRWDSPRMNIWSTMSPDLFDQAAGAIDRYSPDAKGVYMLSEHDTVLTFLANRYSRMPSSDIGTFIYNASTKADVIRTLKDERPAILFVDTCIECSAVPLTPTRKLPGLADIYQTRLRQKISRFEQMRDVFDTIKNDYTSVEAGPLITVYRRKEAK